MKLKKVNSNIPIVYFDLMKKMGSFTETIKEALNWFIAVKRGGMIQILTRHGLKVEERRIVAAHILEGAEIVFRNDDGYFPGTLGFDIEKRRVIVNVEKMGQVVGANIAIPLAVQWIARNEPEFFNHKKEEV